VSTNTSAERSETFTWIDPAIALEQLPRLSGLDYFSGLRDGTIAPPPIASLMNFDLIDATYGHVEFQCWPGEAHYNPLGMVQAAWPARSLTRCSAAQRTVLWKQGSVTPRSI
jgi:hypothetical protein